LSAFFMLWSRGIDSKEPIPLANVAWARICKCLRSPGINVEEVGLSFRPARLEIDSGLLKRLQIRALAGRYNNSIPTQFLVPIDCLKILEKNDEDEAKYSFLNYRWFDIARTVYCIGLVSQLRWACVSLKL
jgi:hypothetical protein